MSSDGRGSIYVGPGIPRSGDRIDEATLLKLDRSTGRTVWSIDISTLDPSLSGASIRGPIVVDQGTVVVAARTSNRRQRLTSLSLLGIDSATGDAKWLRPLASAGSLPFQQMGQLAHSPIVRDGVGYFSDLIGLAAAVRMATGEVLWARPMPAPDLYARFTRPAFAGNAPVINDHGLFMLSSDGTKIFQIDPESGRTIASRPADQLGESLYLLGIDNDTFVCVSNDRVSYYRADRFATSSPIRSPQLAGTTTDSEGITGRVVCSGDRLLVPVDRGIRLLDPERPAQTGFIELDATGNIAALDGQVIVVDQLHASSFLSWDTASRLLEQRIADDPGAAITLAELAYRADRIDAIVPSVE
ncbi:MAG TPA: PQQ-binding-like beta-propeller repeat protein, partial [Gammaproteobacteria bacterium]|nr:PQQ-binding-like beta-propeller repeat protein [Gammaproteobacteria bacterium]